MASFGAITFNEAGIDGPFWHPDFEGAAVGQMKRIAGGTLVWQYPATAPMDDQLTLNVHLDSVGSSAISKINALKAARGTTDTVTTTDLSRSATLTSVSNVRIYIDQSIAFATLTFIGH